MKNIRILKYSTNEWLISEKDVKEALKDIIENNSDDYSYNKRMAKYTVNKFNIEFEEDIKTECLEHLENTIKGLYDSIIPTAIINLHEVIEDIDFVSNEELISISNYLYNQKETLEKKCNCKISTGYTINNDVISITVKYLQHCNETIEEIKQWFRKEYTFTKEEYESAIVEYLDNNKFRMIIPFTGGVKEISIPIKHFEKWKELHKEYEVLDTKIDNLYGELCFKYDYEQQIQQDEEYKKYLKELSDIQDNQKVLLQL